MHRVRARASAMGTAIPAMCSNTPARLFRSCALCAATRRRLLAEPPRKIRLGDVVRAMEPDFALVECFAAGNQCIITRSCRLRGILHEGLDAFNAVLDKYTLEDLMLRPKDFGVRPAA